MMEQYSKVLPNVLLNMHPMSGKVHVILDF